jgi:hypothetical protein
VLVHDEHRRGRPVHGRAVGVTGTQGDPVPAGPQVHGEALVDHATAVRGDGEVLVTHRDVHRGTQDRGRDEVAPSADPVRHDVGQVTATHQFPGRGHHDPAEYAHPAFLPGETVAAVGQHGHGPRAATRLIEAEGVPGVLDGERESAERF